MGPHFWQCSPPTFHPDIISVARQTLGTGFASLWMSVFGTAAHMWAAVLLGTDPTTMDDACPLTPRWTFLWTQGFWLSSSYFGFCTGLSFSWQTWAQWLRCEPGPCLPESGASWGCAGELGSCLKADIMSLLEAKSVCTALPCWLPVSWRSGEAGWDFPQKIKTRPSVKGIGVRF